MPLLPIQVGPPRQEKDTLDKLVQAFGLAQSIVGTGLAIPKFIQERKLAKAEIEKTEAESALLRGEAGTPDPNAVADLEKFGVPVGAIRTQKQLSDWQKTVFGAEERRAQRKSEEEDRKLLRDLAFSKFRWDTQYTPAQQAQLKVDAEKYAKQLDQLPVLDQRLLSIDRAFRLVDRVKTGPIVGSKPALWIRRALPSGGDVQLLESLLNKEGLETVKEVAQQAGARSIDTEREREYMERVTPGINQHPEVIKTILLTSKSLVAQSKAEIEAKREWLKTHRDLIDYVSPLATKKTYWNEKTGAIGLFDPREGKPGADWTELSARLAQNPGNKGAKDMTNDELIKALGM